MITHTQDKIRLKGVVRQVYKKAGKAIHDYSMIRHKDRILVGVSGGKDSLSLLKMLLMRKAHIPIDFDIVACFVEVNFGASRRAILEDYFSKEAVQYTIKQLDLDHRDINCFWCSWNKRKILFTTAREYNCNKIALAHHLDDIIETILMNLFFHGEVSSMKPKIELFGGGLTIIRPFAYLEKAQIERFHSQLGLVDTGHQCPYALDTKRAVVKKTISQLEKEFPHIKKNIFRSLQKRKIKEDYLP